MNPTVRDRSSDGPGEALVMIHADDLGLTYGANEAFRRLTRMGRCDAGSVMTPCPWFADIADAANRDPTLDIGVHLTLTAEKRHYRWRPLTRPSAAAGLTDADGFLPRTVGELSRRAHPDAVEAELRAQIDAALAAGIDVTHLDDHMGAVLAPKFVDIFVRLGRDYDLPILMPRSLGAFGPVHNLDGLVDPVRHEQAVAAVDPSAGIVAEQILETPWRLDEPVERRWAAHFDRVGAGLTLLLLHPDLPGAIEEIEPETARNRIEDFTYFAGPDAGRRLAVLNARRISPRELRDRHRAKRGTGAMPAIAAGPEPALISGEAPMLTRLWKHTRHTVAVAATAGLLAALPVAAPAIAQVKDAKDVHIIFVTHGPATEPYWSVVKNGVLEAAKVMGVKVDYQAPQTFDVVQMARMIEAATASGPDGIVVSIPDADALEAPIRAAKAAGIPVIVIDTGLEQQGPWDLDLYIGGGSEYENGLRVGEEMAKAGVKHAVCVNHEVGNISLDNRCDGAAKTLGEAGGKVDVVAVSQDPTDLSRRVEAYLSANTTIDGVIMLGPSAADPLLAMFKERGLMGKYKMGTFDLSPVVLDALVAGEMMFAIDSQQYLMGYLPVVFLTQKALYKTMPTDPVWTGPAFVTGDSAAAVVELSKQGIR
jgi:simple sugar transport system substrate-binding protein